MSVRVDFYTFSKPKNDVVQPDTVAASFDVVLKEPCSVLNPSFYIKTATNPVAYNYCYVQAFGRYYFITDWESDHNLWWAHCTVDPLASWKTQILGTTQYVLRSSSECNEYIYDTKIPMSKDVLVKNTSVVESPLHPYIGGGCVFILQIANDTMQKINGVQYLACNQTAMTTIINTILNNNNAWGWGPTEAAFGLTDSVARAIINPLQYIGKCYMLPFSTTDISDKVSYTDPIKVGFWPLATVSDVYALAYPAPGAAIYHKSGTLTLTEHPKAASHGKWLNGYPFTKHYLYAGPFGRLSIDTDLIIEEYNSGGTCDVSIDLFIDYLGMATLIIYKTITGKGQVVLAKAYADVSTTIPLTQTKNDLINFLGMMGGAVSSIVSMNAGSSLSNIAGVASSIDMAFPKPEVKGFAQSALQTFESWYHQEEYMMPVSIDYSGIGVTPTENIVGRPLCEVRMLSSLYGFCQVEQPLLTGIPCYDEEKSMIADYLINGIILGAGGV